MKKERKYKVCVYAIAKNEEKFVKKWYESMKEADKIYVLDTGSTDKTFETLSHVFSDRKDSTPMTYSDIFKGSH